jgi:hypothetical protein
MFPRSLPRHARVLADPGRVPSGID